MIYRSILRLSEKGDEISSISVCSDLNLNYDSGEKYIADVMTYVLPSSSMRYSCERLKELSIRRKMNYFALNIPDLSERSETLQDFIESVDMQYNDVLTMTDTSNCRSVDDVSIGLMTQIDAAHSNKLPVGIRSYYEQLDDIFRFMPSRYYVNAARTSVGKSSFALALANKHGDRRSACIVCVARNERGGFDAEIVAMRAGIFLRRHKWDGSYRRMTKFVRVVTNFGNFRFTSTTDGKLP